MKPLSFKEYLESKEVLRTAVIESTPKRTAVYEIKKRCTLATGEYEEDGSNIHLKPNQKLIIEWLLSGDKKPLISNITLESDDSSETLLTTYWKEKRFIKWLSKNTKQTSQ